MFSKLFVSILIPRKNPSETIMFLLLFLIYIKNYFKTIWKLLKTIGKNFQKLLKRPSPTIWVILRTGRGCKWAERGPKRSVLFFSPHCSFPRFASRVSLFTFGFDFGFDFCFCFVDCVCFLLVIILYFVFFVYKYFECFNNFW